MAFLYSFKNSKNINEPLSNGSDDSISTLVASSSTTSIDRSSTGSLPWTEDAVKQNQQEWEKIERIFYGEEDLPNDPKTKEEFLEWMTVFPHLRVIGKRATIYYDPNGYEEDENYEEVFAIDPPVKKSDHNFRKKDFTHLDDKYFGKMNSNSYRNRDEAHDIGNLNNEITKYLKISPSPVLQRRSIEKVSNFDTRTLETKSPYYLKIPSSNGIRLINLKNAPIASFSSHNNSLSASHVRMPPIFSIKILPPTPNNNLFNQVHRNSPSQQMIKSAAVGQLRNRLTLPAIDVRSYSQFNNTNSNFNRDGDNRNFIEQNNIIRSISAENQKKLNEDNVNPRSASKLKMIEFR